MAFDWRTGGTRTARALPAADKHTTYGRRPANNSEAHHSNEWPKTQTSNYSLRLDLMVVSTDNRYLRYTLG